MAREVPPDFRVLRVRVSKRGTTAVQTAARLVQHTGVSSRRCMAAEEIRNKMLQAYDDGDMPRARRLETFYEEIMECSPEEFAELHD